MFKVILLNTIIYNKDTLCNPLEYTYLVKSFGIKALRDVSLIHQKQEKSKMVNFNSYFQSVINGTLYDGFIKSYSNVILRDEAKDIVFKVLFSKNSYFLNSKKIVPYQSDKEKFSSVYPFVNYAVEVLKRKDYKKLAIFLQRLESYLFIDCISKELVENGIIPLTIHDCILVKRGREKETVRIMEKVFLEKLGVIPTFEIK